MEVNKNGTPERVPGRTVVNQQSSLIVIPNHDNYSLDSQCTNCGDISKIHIPKGTYCREYVAMCNNCGCKEKRAFQAVNSVLFNDKVMGESNGKWWKRGV